MDFYNSIYYKSLSALYNLNVNRHGRTKSFMVDAIFKALVMGKDGLDEAKLEMALVTATGEWLDYWGTTFGIYRMHKEDDDPYRRRIIEEVIAPKNTIPALKKATSRYLDIYKGVQIDSTDVNIFEPWTKLIILSERGTLNGGGRLMSQDYWRHSVIDISLPNSDLITADLIEYLSHIKAGGVKIKFSISPVFPIIIDPDWEKKRFNISQKIHQERFIRPVKVNNMFKILPEHDKGDVEDSSTVSYLNSHHKLCGSPDVYWSGVELARTYYATGVLRDFRGSAIMGASALEKTLNRSGNDITLAEFIAYEEESLKGSREREGTLTMLQGGVEVVRSVGAKNKFYVPYERVGHTGESYGLFRDQLIDYIPLSALERLDMTVEDAYRQLCTVDILGRNEKAKQVQLLERQVMETSRKYQSWQMQIEINHVAK